MKKRLTCKICGKQITNILVGTIFIKIITNNLDRLFCTETETCFACSKALDRIQENKMDKMINRSKKS